MSNPQPKYRRVLLKISGEALSGDEGFGLVAGALEASAREIAAVAEAGVQTAVVVGGGNFIRGRQMAHLAVIGRASADMMGMLGTTINAIALAEQLRALGVDAVATGTVTTAQVCEPYTRRDALAHLQAGRIVVLAGGTGSPFFSTDTCAALRAAELDVEMICKATKVDGVFTADPVTDPSAEKFQTLTFAEMLSRQLGVMDLSAASMCQESKIPVMVFKFAEPGNMMKVVCGEPVGTVIRAE